MANAVWQATITDQSGNVLPGAEVAVVNEATGLSAPLFTTRTGTAKSNPFFADANGFAQFYAAPGLYRITATSAGTGTTMTWRNVRLVEIATPAEAIAGTADVLLDAAVGRTAIRALAVGTVSQSGGVPTGAIIQRGSNANGEFVRFADGTQICTRTVTMSSDYSIIANATMPINFLAGSNTSAAIALAEETTGLSAGEKRDCAAALSVQINQAFGTRWQCSVSSIFSVPSGAELKITLMAIGRWY